MLMSNKFIKTTKTSDELSDTISVTEVCGYIYSVSGDLMSLLETSLLTSNRLINVIPTWCRWVSVTRLREFVFGICASRYPSAGCMAGSHQQQTADIYTYCWRKWPASFLRNRCSPHTHTHTHTPSVVPQTWQGTRPFLKWGVLCI
jgi:hypothetical protein